MTSDLYFCGDIHDSSIIILGDFGVGFSRNLETEYNKTKSRLEKNNLTIYVLRGNHDDPDYFKDESHDFPRLKFLQDHKVYNICDRKIYTIGGAYSTDANTIPEYSNIDRKILNEKRLAKGKMPVWWENENVVKKYSELPTKVDIIISHTAPLNFDPVPMRDQGISIKQYENIIDERKYLMSLLSEINADYWFYGHFHKSYTGTYNKILYKCLGELELCMAPEHKENNPQGELKNE